MGTKNPISSGRIFEIPFGLFFNFFPWLPKFREHFRKSVSIRSLNHLYIIYAYFLYQIYYRLAKIFKKNRTVSFISDNFICLFYNALFEP